MRLGDLPEIPAWFREALGMTFGCYPQTAMPNVAPLAYWKQLHDIPQLAIERAFEKATMESKQWVPSAPLVRDIALAIAKTLGPKPDYSRPALPEPEPEIDPALRERFDEIKRTHTGPELVREMAKAVLEHIGG